MKKYFLLLLFIGISKFLIAQNDFFRGTWSNENISQNPFFHVVSEWVFEGDSIFIQEMESERAGNGTWSKGTFSVFGDTLNFYITEKAEVSFNTGFAQHWKCSPNVQQYIFKNECDSIIFIFDLESYKEMNKPYNIIQSVPHNLIMEKTNTYPIKSWNFNDFCKFHWTDY